MTQDVIFCLNRNLGQTWGNRIFLLILPPYIKQDYAYHISSLLSKPKPRMSSAIGRAETVGRDLQQSLQVHIFIWTNNKVGHPRRHILHCSASAVRAPPDGISICPAQGASFHRAAGVSRVNPCQLAGLRAVTIHAAPSIITERSPGRPAKTVRTATAARARISSG